jgi:MerR family transcriptional regulator, copper efflux regulator
MTEYTVSQLARAAGVGTETVRHYEELGLIEKPLRSNSGYRIFTAQSVERLWFIRRAKSLGFTLPEIADLLKLSDQRQSDSAADMIQLREAATAKLIDIEARIAELNRMRKGLAQLIATCPGHGRLAACPILSALSDGTDVERRSTSPKSACSKSLASLDS